MLVEQCPWHIHYYIVQSKEGSGSEGLGEEIWETLILFADPLVEIVDPSGAQNGNEWS